MKNLKKAILVLMVGVLLFSGQQMQVNGATNEENDIMVTSFTNNVNVTKQGMTVSFVFYYSDGSTADIAEWSYNKSYNENYTFALTKESFSGDTETVVVVATNKKTGAQISFGAWCDIYGRTGTF